MKIVKLISVIVPFYKELDLIERAVSSAVSQVLPEGVGIEVLIGNDSDYLDGTIRAALSARSNLIVSICNNNSERGPGNARNAAIDRATGDVIAFLDADDYWCPGKLAAQLNLLKQGFSFVCGYYRFAGAGAVITCAKEVYSTEDVLSNTTIGTSTIVITRELLGNNRFQNLWFSQDTHLWAILASEDGFRYSFISEVVTIYSAGGRSSNKWIKCFYFRAMLSYFSLSTWRKIQICGKYAIRGIINHYIRS